MLERLSKTHRNIGLAAIAAILLWFGWTIRSVLNPLILGYLLAYILRPLVQKLQDRGMGRRGAVNIIFGSFGLALLLIGGGIFVQARQFVTHLIQSTEEGGDPFTRAEKRIDSLLETTSGWFFAMFDSEEGEEVEGEETDDGEGAGEPSPGDGDSTDGDSADGDAAKGDAAEGDAPGEDTDPETGAPRPDDGSEEPARDSASEDGAAPATRTDDHKPITLRTLARAWLEDWRSAGGEGSGFSRAQVVLNYVQRIFGSVVSVFTFLILLPVYTYFLLFELERIHDFVRMHVPKKERERVTRIGRQVGSVIANFFRGRLLICFLKGLILAVGLTILQVPYGFLLGILSGFLSLVPFVGPTLGFLGTLMISFQVDEILPGAVWTTPAIWVGPLFFLGEMVEGYILIPKILGDSLGLHPVVILLAVFVGGAALGLFGLLIAIPLAATLIILFRELVMPAIQDFAEEDSHTDARADDAAEAPGA